MSGPGPSTEPRRTPDTVSELVRWAAFSCVLVPVVLLWYGASLAGATGTALGLAAVTGACRVLLRRSEQCAARGNGHHTDVRHTGGRHTGERHTGERHTAGRHSKEQTKVRGTGQTKGQHAK